MTRYRRLEVDSYPPSVGVDNGVRKVENDQCQNPK